MSANQHCWPATLAAVPSLPGKGCVMMLEVSSLYAETGCCDAKV